MGEFRSWIITLSVIVAGWGLLAGGVWLWAANSIPPDEPSDAFGVGPMMLIPVVVLLLLATGAWLMAAVVRMVVLLTRTAINLRPRPPIQDSTRP